MLGEQIYKNVLEPFQRIKTLSKLELQDLFNYTDWYIDRLITEPRVLGSQTAPMTNTLQTILEITQEYIKFLDMN